MINYIFVCQFFFEIIPVKIVNEHQRIYQGNQKLWWFIEELHTEKRLGRNSSFTRQHPFIRVLTLSNWGKCILLLAPWQNWLTLSCSGPVLWSNKRWINQKHAHFSLMLMVMKFLETLMVFFSIVVGQTYHKCSTFWR